MFSFGFYTSNQFSEFHLFACFWKSLIKIRNVMFILFCRFAFFCCHHSPLINFSLKFWKFQSIYDLVLLKVQCFTKVFRLIKGHSVLAFFPRHSGFCMWFHCNIFYIEIIDILKSSLWRSVISLWFSKMENDQMQWIHGNLLLYFCVPQKLLVAFLQTFQCSLNELFE